MLALIVSIRIQPEHREDFMRSVLDDASGSVTNEPGCLRFDVVQEEADPNHIWLYEVYRDQAAFEAHLEAPHYIRWRDTVKDWYAAPTEVARCETVFPAESHWK